MHEDRPLHLLETGMIIKEQREHAATLLLFGILEQTLFFYDQIEALHTI